jgi:hypothetical protein
MDMLRDKNELTNMWMTGKAPWAVWQTKNMEKGEGE